LLAAAALRDLDPLSLIFLKTDQRCSMQGRLGKGQWWTAAAVLRRLVTLLDCLREA
jgi:hypothetical protein